ncbi:ATP-grasp domain-containing protein [uncultured Microscilla sp.]|uniref:ATP-grasp domain-containing protein n=1 Tax=uncultured Microscilla sp. TaxID=432653 RepID=UPI002602C4D5|nr:ATP-grasp domain-containing protein [uncultured Microscilla sp.]
MDKLLQGIDFFCVESACWIAAKKLNVPAYDFSFTPLFEVSRPRIAGTVPTVARLGAIANYTHTYEVLQQYGFALVNSPTQHQLASALEHWYPIIAEFTPQSIVFEQVPTPDEIMRHFELPVFIKGNRQTAQHNPTLAIAHTLDDLTRILAAYQQNNILHWQKLVCREYVPLQKLEQQAPNKVPLSFEFRTFWWQGELVGAGHYWSQFAQYTWTNAQQDAALDIAHTAAQRLQVPFLVIDLALTASNRWVIIECNDAQEAGYAGVNGWEMWKRVIKKENLGNLT